MTLIFIDSFILQMKTLLNEYLFTYFYLQKKWRKTKKYTSYNLVLLQCSHYQIDGAFFI